MKAMPAMSRKIMRGVLPYPDLQRRQRIRRRAFRLVTCKWWPGDQATGMEAAQLALLRLLWLQQLTRDAVSERRGEDAVLLARASLEGCIVGLYCIHSGDGLARMSAASHRADGRAVSYLSDAFLGTPAAINGAVDALGELGPDLDVRDLALWLEREYGIAIAAELYHDYYLPLSHLFTRAYAFSLMRFVDPQGRIRRQPTFPWAKRSAVRMTDGCVGLLAAHLAQASGRPYEAFLDYAAAHFDRMLTPGLVFAVKGSLGPRSVRRLPATLALVAQSQRFAGLIPADSGPGWQEHPDGLRGFFDPGGDEAPEPMFAEPMDDYLAETTPPGDADGQARHRRPSRDSWE
jgi:hypothetical protein